jgi:hypothetical protein
MRTRLLVLLGLLAATGCGAPYRVAVVSGKVTLNGKPLPGAWVHFAPRSSQDNRNPGPTSHGQTDNEGKYTLQIDPEHPGSVVGKCRVFISLRPGGKPGAQPDAGGRTGQELLPRRYNEETELTFDVPREGTNRADFALTTP